jgi:vesicle-fusing ATPase
VTIDPILLRLEDPSVEPEFVDTRHCLTTWGRPPEKLKDLVRTIQDKLKMIVTSESFIMITCDCESYTLSFPYHT